MASSNVEILEGSGPLVEPLPFSDEEFRRRLTALREAMRDQRLDALVSFTPENMYYLTGHDSPGYYFYQATIVTHDHQPVNVLRRIETTNTLGRSWARLAVGYEDREDPVESTLALLQELGVLNGTVGAEAASWFVTPGRYIQLQHGIEAAGGQVMDGSGLIGTLRVTKSAEEIACIREAARCVERGMDAAIAASSEGTTENEVAAATLAGLVRAGSEYAGLPPFITSGPRAGLAHSTWAGRTYQRGDVLNYELPGVVRRYCASLFRCGTVGPAGAEFSRRAAMLQEALAAVIDAMKPGVTSGEVHDASRRVFEKHGYGHHLGHRTGYSVGINYPPDWGEGEIMSIWEGDERQLQPGMTFHLVPGIFDLDAGYTIIVSDTVLVTDDGCEAITNYSREPFQV